MRDLLKVSVVTVVYNAAASIVKTLQSVQNQTYKNIEFIVIDGGSTDAALSIIDEYTDIISTLVLEGDNGVYDAMNKGAELATGDFTTFLNAGDIYHSDAVVEKIFADDETTRFDVIYGSNYYHINKKMMLQVPRPLEMFYKGMSFNHQSAFVSKIFGLEFKVAVYVI